MYKKDKSTLLEKYPTEKQTATKNKQKCYITNTTARALINIQQTADSVIYLNCNRSTEMI